MRAVAARTGQTTLLIAVTLIWAGCWRTGEPTPSAGVVAWTAFPESVRVAETFLFEFAGPITPTACGRLDTATVVVGDGVVMLDARRSTFEAVCANQRISFYEARPLSMDRPGTYVVQSTDGRQFGTITATDSGPFSAIRTRGDGTIREIPGCTVFGPGWIGNQRVFALAGVPSDVREVAGSDRIVHIRGTLRGFSSCGNWGSRPRIRLDTAWVTDRDAGDWYPSGGSDPRE